MNVRERKTHVEKKKKKKKESHLSIVVSQTKLLEEKDRLRKLCHKEVIRLLKKKKEEPQTKRKKANEDTLLNTPTVTSVDEFVGKRVQHLTFDYDGKENGSQVSWYVRNQILIPSL